MQSAFVGGFGLRMRGIVGRVAGGLGGLGVVVVVVLRRGLDGGGRCGISKLWCNHIGLGLGMMVVVWALVRG